MSSAWEETALMILAVWSCSQLSSLTGSSQRSVNQQQVGFDVSVTAWTLSILKKNNKQNMQTFCTLSSLLCKSIMGHYYYFLFVPQNCDWFRVPPTVQVGTWYNGDNFHPDAEFLKTSAIAVPLIPGNMTSSEDSLEVVWWPGVGL